MRTRNTVALCTAVAMINAAMSAASATSTIVAGEQLGAGWGALPNTAGIIGSGLGALALSRLTRRWGRVNALVAAFAVAVLGSCVTAGSVAVASWIGLTSGMALLGVGNAAALLSRYAVAELHPLERRGRAIGTVVWSATLGAVGGPLLLAPSGHAVIPLGLPPMTGPFALAAITCALALIAGLTTTRHGFSQTPLPGPSPTQPDRASNPATELPTTRLSSMRPDAGVTVAPQAVHAGESRDASARAAGVHAAGAEGMSATFARESGGGRAGEVMGEAVSAGRMSLRGLAGTSVARSALVVMVTAQVVMVAVMTAAPLDIHLHGQGMEAVGVVLAAHTLGMFGLSPLTGKLVDRHGPRVVMTVGLVTLVVAVALVPVARLAGLFLLGYGWNLGFVGGSARLAKDLPEHQRSQVEGTVDGAIWMLAAVASLVSTPLLALGGPITLSITAAALPLTIAASRLLTKPAPGDPRLPAPRHCPGGR